MDYSKGSLFDDSSLKIYKEFKAKCHGHIRVQDSSEELGDEQPCCWIYASLCYGSTRQVHLTLAEAIEVRDGLTKFIDAQARPIKKRKKDAVLEKSMKGFEGNIEEMYGYIVSGGTKDIKGSTYPIHVYVTASQFADDATLHKADLLARKLRKVVEPKHIQKLQSRSASTHPEKRKV